MEIFTVQNLSFRYPQKEWILKNVTFDLVEGEILLLLGASGSGKTTLLRQLKPQICPKGEQNGNVYFNGKTMDSVPAQISSSQIGFVFQDPAHQVVTDKVWHELVFGMENLGYSQWEMELRLGEVANYFGITDWLDLPVNSLSGGQLQIVNLAAVMMLEPKVILLDEPTSQLDPIAAGRFLQLLKRLNRELGIAMIVVEHRMEELFSMTDRIGMLEKGSMVFYGTKAEFVRNSRKKWMDFLPVPAKIAYYFHAEHPEEIDTVAEGRKFLEYYMHTHPVANVLQKDVRKAESHKIFSNKKQRKQDHGKKKICVSGKHLYFRYEKQAADIIKNASFQLYTGEILGILGGNGAGKSTLLKLLCGIQKPYSGKVKVQGGIGYLPQDPKLLFLRETVAEECVGAAEEQWKLFGLSHLKQQHPYDLSGGEQQRLALFIVMQKKPDILLLDEPTKGLDFSAKKTLGTLLKKLQNDGKTILMVSHDIEFLSNYTDRCGLLFEGNMKAVQNTHYFFHNNLFYTTTVRRMTKGIVDGLVTMKDVISAFQNIKECGKNYDE